MRDGVQIGLRLAEASATRQGHRPPVAWFVTLTYRQPEAYEPGHISRFVQAVRKWGARLGFEVPGTWVAEMQDKRFERLGELAIHYHVVIWLPRGVTPPKPDKRSWWPHGMTRVERVRKSAGAYMAKYTSKGSESPLPKGARIYGVFGLAAERVRYTWLRRPTWLRRIVEVGERLRRRRGGGWLRLETGEVLMSPWQVIYSDGWIHLRLFEASGVAA